ncbi:MAG: ATP-binding protein [Deltaproteobacteria bacterium]|nr:ATP-binding protein [Deltaproteobacteria bacterium]
MDINYLLELDQLARQEGEKYSRKRLLYSTLQKSSGKHFSGIIGPRGAGKTVLLKQLLIEQENAFYISVDTITSEDLFQIAKHLKQALKVDLLLLDEIHFQKNYDAQLKKIYDSLGLKIIFTSSVALAIDQSAYDLSRRVHILKLPLFSFREFIYFTNGVLLPILSMQDIIEQNWTGDHMRHSYLFDEYLRGGILPFALDEPNPIPLLANILKKIISRDIPSIIPLLVEELPVIEKMVKFIGKSTVDSINYSSISRNVGITKYKAESYLDILTQALVTHVIFPKGTGVMREPKVLLSPPYRLLYNDYEYVVGGLREDFFAEMLANTSIEFHYLKSTRGSKTPDFLVRDKQGDIVLEVGGKGKGRSQFKGIKVNRKIILSHGDDSSDIRRPLFLLGYLY